MSMRAIALLSVAGALTATAAACTLESTPLAPPGLSADSSTATSAGARSLPALRTVHTLQRDRGLDRDASWSFVVGPMGGAAHDPATGLTIAFAHDAVPSPVRITVTALAGSDVAYRFEPHGLHFAAPVTLTQSLRGMHPWRADTASFPLVGSYFAGDRPPRDTVTGGILVSEILPATVEASGVVRFRIQHFSGYTVASAVRDSLPDGGGR